MERVVLKQRHRNNAAFTLIEVLVTLLLVAAAMGVMCGLQVRSYNRLTRDRQHLSKLCLLKRSFVEALGFVDPENLLLVKKEYEYYDFKTKTEFYDIAKKSSLKPFAKNVRMVMTDASWQVNARLKEHLTLVSFVCVPGVKEAKA